MFDYKNLADPLEEETPPLKLAMLVRANQIVREICEASPTLDDKKIEVGLCSGTDIRKATHKAILEASSLRREHLITKFQALGYDYKNLQFKYHDLRACSVKFTNPNADKSLPKIIICAHHDYISGQGASDDASGLAVMLELARIFKDTNLNIEFISFDLEEIGLSGSEDYFENLPEEERSSTDQVIIAECLGSPNDLILCESIAGRESDPEMIERFKQIAIDLKIPLSAMHCLGFSNDQATFADNGIPGVSFTGINLETSPSYRHDGGRAEEHAGIPVHTDNDIASTITGENMVYVILLIEEYIRRYKSLPSPKSPPPSL